MFAPLFLFALAFLTPVSAGQVPEATVVAGRVVDGAGAPLPLVNVVLAGTIDGDVTDEAGHFAFPSRHQGTVSLRATLVGFETVETSVGLVPGDTTRVVVRMQEVLMTLGEVAIEGSAFRTGDAPTATLSALEVVTTPGAAADTYRALQAFPGVTIVDEGAGLFVRGGDVSETAILLDGAVLQHPYRYESATGGIFGTIPPFFLKDTYFSAGGFSARHGDALSGVVALETLDEPQQSSAVLNAGLAGASLGLHTRLLDGRLGVRLSGNRSATGLLMSVNGLGGDFAETPSAFDTNVSVAYRYRPTGIVKAFVYTTESRVGARTPQPSFEGVYRSAETNRLYVLRWQDLVSDWLLKGSLSTTTFTGTSALGNLDLTTEDAVLGGRFDAERSVVDRLRLAVGTEVRRSVGRFRGQVPAENDILDPDAATTAIDARSTAVRTGGYGLAEVQLGRRLFANVGLRADHHTEARQAVLDPRAALRYQLTEDAHLQVATGRYSQFPAPEQFDGAGGSTGLRAQQALHLIAGAEVERGHLRLRAEAYWKQYSDLLVRIPDADSELGTRWANDGTGAARGIDVFAQYGAFLRTRFNGWLSYSLLRSERTQTRWRGDIATLGDGPTPFDVTHHLTAVGKVRLWRFLTVGTTLRLATGRPHTPVVNAQQAAPMSTEGGYFLPVEGPVGSERLPTFSRVDMSASWYQPFGDSHAATFYVSLANALGHRNVIGYDYSADYTTRTPRRSDYDRFIYVGVSLEFVR